MNVRIALALFLASALFFSIAKGATDSCRNQNVKLLGTANAVTCSGGCSAQGAECKRKTVVVDASTSYLSCSCSEDVEDLHQCCMPIWEVNTAPDGSVTYTAKKWGDCQSCPTTGACNLYDNGDDEANPPVPPTEWYTFCGQPI